MNSLSTRIDVFEMSQRRMEYQIKFLMSKQQRNDFEDYYYSRIYQTKDMEEEDEEEDLGDQRK